MTHESMEETLKRLRQAGKEIVGAELPLDFTSHKKHPHVPGHVGKIWVAKKV